MMKPEMKAVSGKTTENCTSWARWAKFFTLLATVVCAKRLLTFACTCISVMCGGPFCSCASEPYDCGRFNGIFEKSRKWGTQTSFDGSFTDDGSVLVTTNEASSIGAARAAQASDTKRVAGNRFMLLKCKVDFVAE